MISLREAQPTDGLPESIRNMPWARALDYAERQQNLRQLEMADRARIYAVFKALPEGLLDVLAVEMRVPNYLQSYSLEVKNTLVRNAYDYWSKMGTKYAVEELCKTIFGSAEVLEWFDYDGEPGHFRIVTGNLGITQDNIDEFMDCINRVKRLSAHLDELVIEFPEIQLSIAGASHVSDTQDLDLDPTEQAKVKYIDSLYLQMDTGTSNIQDIDIDSSETAIIRYRDGLTQYRAKPLHDVQDIEININVGEELKS